MATGGSTLNTSDELFDISCSPCSKDSRNNEAVKYCVDCQEYLCVSCVESHNRFSALVGHTLLGRSQFGTSRDTDAGNLPSVPTERYNVKISTTFRLIQTIPQADHVQQISDEIKSTISRFENLMKEKQKAKDDNIRSKETCLKAIRAFKAEINQALDRLEKASIAKADENYDKLDNGFKEELRDIQETLDRLTKSKTEMESSKKNISQQFVSTKICEKIISDTEKDRTDSADMQGGLTFARNPEIVATLQNLDSLGNLQGQQKHSLYAIKGKDTYSVKLKDDSEDCDIRASCILDTGDILLADHNNRKIKLVERNTYTVKHSMTMSYRPWSVCKVSATEAVVTFSNYKTVQFVSTKDQLVPTRSLKFGHDCRGIAVIDGRLVLCENGSKAYIYIMNGDRLKTIEKDKSGNDIFVYIREISVSDNGKMIHVADRNKGLITIDKDGSVIWKYSGVELKSAWGVCTDGSGNVFVSGNVSHNVVQIGSDGQYMGEVIPASHGIKDPKAVCFDRKNSKLIVAGRNELYAFLVQ